MRSGEHITVWHQKVVHVDTRSRGQGLHDVTSDIAAVVTEAAVSTGLCAVFVRHTSCSLVIQENADPSARRDLEHWITKVAPENDPDYTHTLEGADDMPVHLRSVITKTTEQIPIVSGALGLGTWQGIYLWEHRRRGSTRSLVVTVLGE